MVSWFHTIDIHIDKCISAISVKTCSFFMLIVSSLLFAPLISLFHIILKTTPEVNTNLKSYNFIFKTSMNNRTFYLKHVLLLFGDIDINSGPKSQSLFRFFIRI